MRPLLTAAAVALALSVPAFASAQSVEPESSILTKGRDVEWSQGHLSEHASSAEHRAYHIQADKLRQQWYAEHDESEDGYARLRRLFHQEMNEAHRQYHWNLLRELMGDEWMQEMLPATDGASMNDEEDADWTMTEEDEVWMAPMVSEELWNVIRFRRVEVRPSRRQIVENAHKQFESKQN